MTSALSHVALGDPHVAAHNDERDAINELQTTVEGLGNARTTNFIVVRKDPVTGFWPTSYAADGTPSYSGGASNSGKRPSTSSDVIVAWLGVDPSPPVVTSGDGGMLDDADVRWVISP